MKDILLKEELTKTDVRDIVKDEVQRFLKSELKKMVEEELKKVLKDRDMKNEIGDISKEILKKLYKELSVHQTYVVDRVSFQRLTDPSFCGRIGKKRTHEEIKDMGKKCSFLSYTYNSLSRYLDPECFS